MDLAPKLRPAVLAALAFLALASLSACGGNVSPGGGSGGAQGVVVEVQPSTAHLPPGGTQKFASAVTGTADTSVVWQVVDAGGGTVDPTGLYVAPVTPGTYRVRASSHADLNSSGTATVTVTAPPVVTVAISPKTPTVAAGGTVAFTATVGNTTNTAVTWSVQETTGCGSVTQAGVYTAPGAGATCHVVATSVADASKSDIATVTVTPPPPPVVVTIAPSPASVNSCKSLTFTATVTGATNTSVTWSVQEGAAGGSISSAGVYTAPSSAGTYHVVATSVASPAASTNVPVTVTDKILSVAVSPQAPTVTTTGSVQFTATVTTTCGSFAATQAVN